MSAGSLQTELQRTAKHFTRDEALELAKATRKKAAEIERAAGVRSDAERMAASRAAKRDLDPPTVLNRDRRSEAEDNDPLWLTTYLPRVFSFSFSPKQLGYIQAVGEALRYGQKRAIAAPRGDGKSSIARYLALKYALERRIRSVVILSASGPKSAEHVLAIKQQLIRRKSPLSEDYPLECTLAAHIHGSSQKIKNATVRLNPILAAWSGGRVILPQFAEPDTVDAGTLFDYGLAPGYPSPAGIILATGWKSQEIQGANILDVRPDFVLLDDLDDRGSLASEIGSAADKIETMLETNVAGMRGIGEKLGQVMLCTCPARHSVAFKYTDPEAKPAWCGTRTKRIEKWPDNQALSDHYIDLYLRGKKTIGPDGHPVDPNSREAFRFYMANQAAIEAGLAITNENDYERGELKDGTAKEISAYQHCLNFIADHSRESFNTEYQNDPPAEIEDVAVKLTAYHVRANSRSGLPRYVVPAGTTNVSLGADISEGGIYWASIAWEPEAVGSIVDFDYWKIEGLEGVPASAAELLVLNGLQQWWSRILEEPYEVDGDPAATYQPDLCLVDSGWKEEKWGIQPVYVFCAGRNFNGVGPCKGIANWRPRKHDPPNVWAHDNANVVNLNGVPLAELNVDALKLKVHRGLLQEFGTPGSLGVYSPEKDESGRENWRHHQNLGNHVCSEEWQQQPNGVWMWVKAGTRPGGRRRKPKANHWLDALAYAVAARTILGVSTIQPAAQQPQPRPQQQPQPATPRAQEPRTESSWLPQR